MSPIHATKKSRAGLMSRLRATTFLIGVGGVYCIAHPALANPQGGVVVGGQATITAPAANTLTIDQSTKIVIIDWNSFNIGKGQTTQFVQPNANSTAVNRIGGDNPSVILGNLNANGQVILINGDGLLFGAGAKINVGSLIATTHDASNADLMSGKANFDGAGSSTASITNNGRINATSGLVGLIAPAVANNGLIRAKLGGVTLGAASQFTLDFTGDGLISFPVDADVLSRALGANGKPVEALVINRGRIEGTTVLLSAHAAQDIVENVISMGGLIRASAATRSGGSIILDGGDGGVSVSGTLNVADTAPGATGGTIEVLGDSITLNATARLDASGDGGGGAILIGGDLHGAGPLPNATNTVVAAGATLNADALTKGDGGTVVVWADGSTNFAGAISAKGGAAGGDGGFVETSGAQNLTVADGATVDTLAPKGAAGDWLLDPANITVATGGSATVSQADNTSDTSTTITIDPATIDGAMSNVILAASNSIVVSNAISLTNSGVGITFEGSGATPAAGPSSGSTLFANITTNNGAVTIDGPTTLGANVTITAGTGAVDFAGTVDGAYALIVSNSGATTFGGDLGDNAQLASVTTGAGLTTLDGNLTTNNGAVTINGATALGATSGVTINAGTGAVDFVGAVNSAASNNIQPLTINNSGGVTFGGEVGMTYFLRNLTTGTGTTTLNGDLSVLSVTDFNGPVTLGADVNLNGSYGAAITFGGAVNGAHNLTVEYSNGTLAFDGAVGSTTPLSSLTTTGIGALAFDGAVTTSGAITITGAATLGGDVTTGDGAVTFDGATTLGNDITVNAGTGSISFNSTVDGAESGAQSLVLTTSGTMLLHSPVGQTTPLSSLTMGTGPIQLDANINTTGAQSYLGAVQLLGPLIMNAGAGAVIFASTIYSTTVPIDFNSLTVNTSAVATFDGAVNMGGEILRTGTGQTIINAPITTAWRQYYQGPVTLNATALSATDPLATIEMDGALTLTSDATITSAGPMYLEGSINGAYNLTINGGQNAYLSGSVGGVSPLASLTFDSTTVLGSNVSITTTGPQSYDGAVILYGGVALNTTNASVSFNSTIDSAVGLGAPANLSVSTGGGEQTYSGALGSEHALGAVVLNSGNAAGLLLTSTTNNIARVNITGGGAVTVADSGALTVNGINTTGDILVTTQSGDLTISGAVVTTSATANALTLEAGASADRVASAGVADTNGDVVIASGGGLSIGAGGFGAIYTGGITGSTGLSAVVGAGDYRYWSDTNGDTGYTTPLSSGVSAIYREQPIVTVAETALGGGRTYDGTTTDPTLSTTGQVNGDVGSGTATVTIANGAGASSLLNAGSYTLSMTNVSAGSVLGGLGYAVQAGGATSSYVIIPATVTITGVVAADKTYDGTTAATLTDPGALTGLAGGQTLTLTPTAATFADANAGVGKTVTVTGYTIADGTGLASNYVLSSTTAITSATIDPAVLTAGLTGTVSKTYDGTAAANLTSANYTLSGTVFGGDAVALNDPASGAYADADAGTGKTVSVTGLALNNANYVLAQTTASAAIGVIDPAVLTAGLTGTVSKTYDGTAAANLTSANYTLSGTVFGGDAVALNDPASGAYADADAGTGKTVSVTGLALNNANYVLAQTTASAAIGVIDPAVLTAGLTGTVSKTYDGTAAANLTSANYTLSGTVFGGDAVALNDPASGAYADANAGTGKTVSVTGLALNNANYVLAQTTASAAIGVIDPAVLTAGLTGTVSKTYDGTAAANLTSANYTLSGTVFGGDAVALNDPASGAYADANAGTGKTVSVTGLALNNANYVLAQTTASAAIGVIDPAALTGLSASSETVGLTSMVSVTYDSAVATNIVIPITALSAPPSLSPTDLVSALYVDYGHCIGSAPPTDCGPQTGTNKN